MPLVNTYVLNRAIVRLSVPVLLAIAGAARAQVPLPTQSIDSGVAVRLQFDTGAVLIGRLLARYQPGASVLRLCRQPGWACPDSTAENVRVVPTAAVRGVEIYRASGGVWRGALIGASLGALGGLAGRQWQILMSDSDARPGYNGLLWGVIMGTVAGAFLGEEAAGWHPAP